MARQPRTARASLPGPRLNMTPTHTFRLFIISLIIATTIIESPVSAIAMKTRQIFHEDSVAEDSVLDELVNDSALASIGVDAAKNDSTPASTVANAAKQTATTTSAKVIELVGNPTAVDKKELTTAFILLKTDDGYVKISGLPIYTSSVKETEPISSLEATDLPASTLDDNSKIAVIKELTSATDPEFTSSTTQNRSIDYIIDSPTTQETPVEITIDATTLNQNSEFDVSTMSETKLTESNNPTRESIDTTSQSDVTATLVETNEQNSLTPSWKKYTTINRTRVDPEMNTSSTEEIVQTTPTRISLEKLLTDTSISSLGQLGESLSSKVTYAFDLASTSPFVQETIRVSPETTASTTTSSTVSTTASSTASSTASTTTNTTMTSQRTLQITSKRGGFLDFSAKPVAEATTIIENYDTPGKTNESRGFSSMFYFEPDNDSASVQNSSKHDLASQSQMAEDVMREEMMKEEMLNNEEENANRHKESEQLSVKPIDKNSLYSVGPNYKPMKKLDVQPAKPFIRDPDDLSWRNESISSLGIVFKANPAAKNFTEVLKNKTETLFNNTSDKDSKNDLPDLRERLEKIAEVRKSKKKKVFDKFGDTIYTDYEESSHSAETSSAGSFDAKTSEANATDKSPAEASIAPPTTTEAFESVATIRDEPEVTTHVYVKHVFETSPYHETENTKRPGKLRNDYFDIPDDYDGDYLNLPKIELKKFSTRLTTKEPALTSAPPATSPLQRPGALYWPDRRPTLQYFPPRPNTQKINIQTFDENPINKLNYYSVKDTTNNLIPVSVTFTTLPAPQQTSLAFGQKNRLTTAPVNKYTNDLTKTVYYTQPKVSMSGHGYVDDGRYNRPTYVIKHFKDLVEKAARTEDEKDTDYDTYTSTPRPGRQSTAAGLLTNTAKLNLGDDYEDDSGFRKDVINRFVDNFNQNSERFKVDFPILYNSSVVHRKEAAEGGWATSSAFMRRLYEDMAGRRAGAGPCEGCERAVELPPEYELHYYVPEQEEREEAEARGFRRLWDARARR